MAKVRAVAAAAGSAVLMSLSVPVMAALRLLTLGGARRLCAEGVTRSVARACLRMAGVRLVVHRAAPLPEGQVIYTANHSSTLDLFVLLALGLPRTRYFMKRASLLVPPVGLIGALIGTFFTPPQTEPAARVRCFRAACRRLRETGDSAYLSPEGTRVTTGQIGHFNKGAFHLATELRAPIVPLYFHIPRAVNPGKGLLVPSGTVHVHVLPPIRTDGWRVEDVEQNAAYVREMYVAFAAEVEA